MKKCPNCGYEDKDDIFFCNCHGTPLESQDPRKNSHCNSENLSSQTVPKLTMIALNFLSLFKFQMQPINGMILKRRIGTLFLMTCLILITIPNAFGAEITISPTTGTDAQIAINSAIDSVASGATSSNRGCVLLTAGTFKISAPIILKPNVVLKGAGDSTIIYATSSSVCNSAGASAYILGSGVFNVEVSNLQFKSTATGPGDGGHGDYRNCIQFRSSSNSAVHDILFTRYLYRDGIIISKSSGMNVYNCRMYSTGHDGVAFLSDSKNCRMYNCDVQVQTNTGVRIDNSANCEVDHNTFTSGTPGSGWCCVELENTLTNANVHHNIMHDFRGSSSSAGIGNVHASGSINVHDNVMWSVSPYIQIGSGTGNILGPTDHNVANWVAKGYGYGSIGNPNDQELPVAGFTCSVNSGNAPLKVLFTDISTGTPTSWSWDFGDGTTSTDQNPTHTYSTAGVYTVTLTVSNKSGKASKSGTISVLSAPSLPVFPGYTNPPTDQNKDGLYEDVNGNGILDFDDVVAYNNNMDWIEENAPVALFDYNKNSLIDFNDVVKLHDML